MVLSFISCTSVSLFWWSRYEKVLFSDFPEKYFLELIGYLHLSEV